MVPPVLRGEATWSELRKYGIGWWVRSNDTLRRLIEKVKNKKQCIGNENGNTVEPLHNSLLVAVVERWPL